VRFRSFPRVVVSLVAFLCLLSSARAALSQTDAQLAHTVKLILSKGFTPDWQGIEKIPNVKWAPLPPTMLTTRLPDGGCFTRQGVMVIGDRKFVVLASGARTFVTQLYLRNATVPVGETAVVAALKQDGFSTELVRCPMPNTTGGTNWYRLKSPSAEPGYLSIQTSTKPGLCAGLSILSILAPKYQAKVSVSNSLHTFDGRGRVTMRR
jgi:hypothetical protein